MPRRSQNTSKSPITRHFAKVVSLVSLIWRMLRETQPCLAKCCFRMFSYSNCFAFIFLFLKGSPHRLMSSQTTSTSEAKARCSRISEGDGRTWYRNFLSWTGVCLPIARWVELGRHGTSYDFTLLFVDLGFCLNFSQENLIEIKVASFPLNLANLPTLLQVLLSGT